MAAPSENQHRPDPRDLIEREPPNWRVLGFAAVAVVLIFFILIPWLLLRFSR